MADSERTRRIKATSREVLVFRPGQTLASDELEQEDAQIEHPETLAQIVREWEAEMVVVERNCQDVPGGRQFSLKILELLGPLIAWLNRIVSHLQ